MINGNIVGEKRDQIIRAFYRETDPKKSVMLFSAVGSVGLNLMCADTVIIFVSTPVSLWTPT